MVKKENLLLVAAIIWIIAGIMLEIRGLKSDTEQSITLNVKLLIGIPLGLLFYVVMFRKIVNNHINRILALSDEKLYFYRFFNKRSYIMMLSMISLGILLRLSGIVPLHYLTTFYIVMGIPLIISGVCFASKRFTIFKKTFL